MKSSSWCESPLQNIRWPSPDGEWTDPTLDPSPGFGWAFRLARFRCSWAPAHGRRRGGVRGGSDRRADRAEDRTDLTTKEDECHDRDDCDQRQDQRIFGEALTFVPP